MNSIRETIVAALIAVAMFVGLTTITSEVALGRTRFGHRITIKCEPLGMHPLTETLTLKCVATIPEEIAEDVDSVRYAVPPELSSIELHGDSIWWTTTNSPQGHSFELTVSPTPSDTTVLWIMGGASFSVRCSFSFRLWFLSTEDSVEVRDLTPALKYPIGDPRWKQDEQQDDDAAETEPTSDVKETTKKEHTGRMFSLTVDSLTGDTIEYKTWEIDTTTSEDSVRQMWEKKPYEELRELEKEPLTDRRFQDVRIGDEVYRRYRGETEFQLLEPIHKSKLHLEFQRRMDSIQAIPDTQMTNIGFLLPDSASRAEVEKIIGPGKPSTHKDVFLYRIPWGKIKAIVDMGFQAVEYEKIPAIQPLPKDGEDGEASESRGSYQRREGDSLIYLETFGPEYGQEWWAYDTLDSYVHCGADYWGYSSIHGGSSWCNGVGEPFEPGYYDCMIDSRMFSPMISLQGYGNVDVWWEMDWDVAYGFDHATMFYSYDGEYWWNWCSYSGSSGGWQSLFIDGINQPQLYLKFTFQSDWELDYNAGAFLDNLRVYGVPMTYPDLRWFPEWPGWDWPLVVSAEPGNHQLSDIVAGQTAYLDYGLQNDGDAPAYAFYVKLYDNGICTHTFFHPDSDSLDPGEIHAVLDLEVDLYVGWHTLVIVADPQDYWPEWDETNNACTLQVYVQPAEVSYSGHIFYQDPLPPTLDTLPAEGVKIELWDEQMLDSDVADHMGGFDLGPVANVPFGIGRDIHFRLYIENEACYITRTLDGERYFIISDTMFNHPSGEYDTTIVMNLAESGGVYVAEQLLQSRNAWLSVAPPGYEPDTVRATVGAVLTAYEQLTNSITVLSGGIDSLNGPDHFDAHLIHHEYAHYLADELGILFIGDSSQGYWDALGLSDTLVAQETWAEFWSFAATGEERLRDWGGYYEVDSTLRYWDFYDAETGQVGTNLHYYPDSSWESANNGGLGCIAAMTGALWDIVDSDAGLEDFSTFG